MFGVGVMDQATGVGLKTENNEKFIYRCNNYIIKIIYLKMK